MIKHSLASNCVKAYKSVTVIHFRLFPYPYFRFQFAAYFYDGTIVSWEPEKWEDEFRKNQLLVIVHDTLLMLLEDGFLGIKMFWHCTSTVGCQIGLTAAPYRINLIVLDECHHATKDHPYRKIMSYLHSRGDAVPQPKILGLSASVINIKLKVLGKYKPFVVKNATNCRSYIRLCCIP